MKLDNGHDVPVDDEKFGVSSTMDSASLGVGTWNWHTRSGHLDWSVGVYAFLTPRPNHPASWEYWISHVHSDDQYMVRQAISAQHSSKEKVQILSYRLIRNDGTMIWIEDRRVTNETGVCEGALIDVTRTYTRHQDGLQISEERNRIRELEESRRFLKLALSANNTAIWEWNKTTNKQVWSDELFRMFGFEPGEVVPDQSEWLSTVHPDDYEWVKNFVLTDGRSEVHAFTYRVVVNGSTRWIRESWNDLTGLDGICIRLGISADITDWKEREHHQSATENWFKLAVDVGRIGLWSRNSDNTTHHWNDHVFLLLGYQLGEVEASDHAWSDRIHPADRDRVVTTIKHRKLDGRESTLEYRVIHPNGDERWLEERAGAIDPDSAVRRGVLIDITEQKNFQHRIEESRQRLQLALDTGSMGFWTGDGIDEYWDEQTYRILGYEPFTVPADSESFLRLVHPDDKSRVLESENRARLTGTLVIEEYRITRPDGSVRWIEARSRVTSNKSLGSYGILHDITDRKIRDEIVVRNSKLLSAGQSLRGLAHDYNHFLAVICASLDSLAGLVHEPKARRRLFEARQTTMAGALFSRRLINISKYREWQPQVLSLGKQISKLTRLTIPLMKPGITVQVECANDLWPINVDPIELDSALINLVLNSRDAMPSGGSLVIRAVNVKVSRDEVAVPTRAGNYVSLTVRDTGKGMDDSTLSRATEPFFTTKREGHGTGLGLSSVTSFTEAAGGHVKIDSMPGLGTTVSLYLPCAEETSQYPEQQDVKLPRGNGELILVVDDEHSIRETIMQRLEALGYVVEEAKDAATALEKLMTIETIDLVLSDIRMPGAMDGISLRDRLAVEMPHLPVLFITSGFEGSSVQNKTLSKSCSQLELATAIALALAIPYLP